LKKIIKESVKNMIQRVRDLWLLIGNKQQSNKRRKSTNTSKTSSFLHTATFLPVGRVQCIFPSPFGCNGGLQHSALSGAKLSAKDGWDRLGRSHGNWVCPPKGAWQEAWLTKSSRHTGRRGKRGTPVNYYLQHSYEADWGIFYVKMPSLIETGLGRGE
jgi:hypothetical protein